MVSLSCETTTVGEATLVTLALSSPDPTHVRVENRLDGPVWPPREQGVPAAGWDESGFSGVVDGTLALGYACPVEGAETTGPPVELVDERPPTDEDDRPTARSLVRDLGDASPPADVVGPVVDGAADHESDSIAADRTPDVTPPPAVTTWLDDVRRRVETADRLSAATSVDEATDAVDAAGGPEEIRTLRDRLATDRATLSAVATRCEELVAETETVEIPVETLARLA